MPETSPRQCPVCGNPLPASSSPRARKYCSASCKTIAWKWRSTAALDVAALAEAAAQLGEQIATTARLMAADAPALVVSETGVQLDALAARLHDAAAGLVRVGSARRRLESSTAAAVDANTKETTP